MNGFRIRIPLAVALVTALAAWVTPASAADHVLHGRVSYDAGGTLVRGADASEWSHATVNTLILPGDTLWMDQGGTGEVEFSGGTFVRLADGSKAEVVALPPSGTLRAWTGSFYVHRLRRSSGSFIVETPAAIVEIEESSSVRIDVVGNGATTVTVRWGRANVRTEAGGVTAVHSGRRLWVDPGLLPSEPMPFERTEEDAFDQWNRERSEYLATGTSEGAAQTYIKEPVLGVSDLDAYGEWIYVDSRRVWRPTVVVDYVPYRYGNWTYVPRYGNCWVGRYPFSYVTGHYGRWDYHSRYGWVWGYEPGWSPAWVTSFRYGDYCAWAPINYRHHPVLVSNSAHFTIGGVQFSLHGTSYASYSHLYGGPSYIHGAYHNASLFSGIHGHQNNVYIWNININTDNHVRTPYNDSVMRVRNYNPRRSIRGVDTYASNSRSASDVVRSLESRSGVERFNRLSRSDIREVRTSATSGSRQANVRRAAITQSAPTYTRATRKSPEVASRVSGDNDARTRINRVNTDNVDRGRGDSVRRTDPVGSRSGVGPDPGRTNAPTRQTRTSVPPRRMVEERGSTPSTSRSEGVTRTPSRSNGDSGRSVVRNTSRTPSRPTITSTGGNDRSTRSNTPQRTEVPRGYTRGNSPTTSREISRPSSPSTSRNITRPSSPSPSRNITRPSSPSPSRSYSRPSSPSPSRSYSRPSSPSPSRSYNRSSGPSSSRSYTRPSNSNRSSGISSRRSSGGSSRSGISSRGSSRGNSSTRGGASRGR